MGSLVSLMVERFSFRGVPEKLEDFESSKGITFKAGYFDGQAIQELTLYNDGIKIDLRSSTEEGQRILIDSLEWMREKAGIAYRSGMISRWAFLSQLVVESEIDLDAVHPAFRKLSSTLTELMSARKDEVLRYRASAVHFDFPRLNSDYPISNFGLERRTKTPDAEHRFYSQAPLQTTQHLRVLAELEQNLKSAQ